jgi:hypothetical protein
MFMKFRQIIFIAIILALLLAMTISIVAAQAAGSLVWSG